MADDRDDRLKKAYSLIRREVDTFEMDGEGDSGDYEVGDMYEALWHIHSIIERLEGRDSFYRF